MQASVIIPVWNGASVISRCLDALYTHSGAELLEVICVDNASSDESANIIARRYPQAKLIREPVNLGFAGGINAGMQIARGDFFVLLNQDCLAQEGWLAALASAFETNPQFGIAGCTIYHANGALDHAGACMTRPNAIGEHLTDVGNGEPRVVEYVTGAAMAIRRQTWDAIGCFDEGYYPAYYEESDYCHRARYKGIETAYVPRARVSHLRSSREAQKDPVKHWANQQRSRYRFISKHFDECEIAAFFEAESAAIAGELYFDQAVGRLIGARDTLRGLRDILERRRLDGRDDLLPAHQRQLQVGFIQIVRQSFAVAEKLIPSRPVAALTEAQEAWRTADRQMQSLLGVTGLAGTPNASTRIDSKPVRALRRFVLRPLSKLTARIPRSRATLVPPPGNAGQTEQLGYQLEALYRLFRDQREQLDRRLTLLEYLADYDYR
jgi:GT2 family glycosyltransferase